MQSKRVLVVGLGNMGMSHALAYARIPEFQVVGVCTRRIADKTLPDALAGAKRYSNYEQALAELEPDVVSINTLPDTHADYAIKAMEVGAYECVVSSLGGPIKKSGESRTLRTTNLQLVVLAELAP